MYNNQLSSQLLRRIFIGVGVVFLLLAIYFIYSHGFMSIKGVSSKASATLVKISNDLSSKPFASTHSHQLVATGNYAVSTPLKDGGSYITNITVPSWLRSVSLPQASYSHTTQTIGRNVLVNIAKTDNGLISFEGADRRTINPHSIDEPSVTDTDSSYPDFVDSKQINKNTIAGYTYNNTVITPVIYSIATKESLHYPPLTTSPDSIAINSDYGLFSLIDMTEKKIYIYNKDKATPTEVILSKNANLSTNDNTPIYSVSNKSIAITTGRSLLSSHDDNSNTDSSSSQEINVLSLSSKKSLLHLRFKNTLIQSIALSPDGAHLAIQTDQITGIYNIDTEKLVFMMPYTTNQFAWVSSDNFIYTTPSSGIFTGSIKNKESRSLVPYKTVRPTSFSFADSNYIYFTGYAGSITGTSQPNAYRSSLTTIASEANRNSLSAFPHQGKNFYVDYIGGIVTVQTTRYINEGVVTIDSAARKDGLNYVKKQLGDSNFKINYVYVNFSTDEFAQSVTNPDYDQDD